MKRAHLKFLIASLATLYAMLAYFTLHPRVSDAYHEYYISKKSDISPKEIDFIQNLTPNTAYNHTSKDIGFKKGWSHPEENHRWSNEQNSSIIFKIENPEKFEGLLKLQISTLGQQNVTLFFNEAHIYTGTMDATEKNIDILLGKQLLKSGINVLSFHFPDARQPNNGDPRFLAMAMKSLQLL